MKKLTKALRSCSAAGVVCLVVSSVGHAQVAKDQAPAGQPSVSNQLSARLVQVSDFKALELRAQKGDARAQFDLGVRYANGDGVPVDREKAVAFYRKAAEQGLASAQATLGRCYLVGQGVTPEYEQAVPWPRKATGQGSASGQDNLGVIGQGVAQDYVEAVKWFRKAADQGPGRP